MKQLPQKLAETALERHVLKWINDEAKDGYRDNENPVKAVLDDLFHGGCASGIVGHLIYTRDTVAFYKKHQKEIDGLLKETLSDIGESPSKLFERAGWDNDDPLAREDGNQNILAWFGFEETARKLGDKAEIEL